MIWAGSVTVATNGAENGQTVTVGLNGANYTGSVSNNSTTITISGASGAYTVEAGKTSFLDVVAGLKAFLSSDNTFTTALIRSGLQKLLDAGHDYTDGDHFFYCSPAAYMSLLSLGVFTEAQKRGDGENPAVYLNVTPWRTPYGFEMKNIGEGIFKLKLKCKNFNRS